MTRYHIAELDHHDLTTANNIHTTMMEAYREEARILDVSQFPPLQRTRDSVQRADSRFVGAFVDNNVVAVIETEAVQESMISIAALVVRPAYFRQGLGRALVEKVIDAHSDTCIVVSTGAQNTPAIALYTQLGFEMSTSWVADQNIDLVKLVYER